MNRMLGLWLGLLLLLAVAARIAAPSDLYDNDQPKTVAYTVDMLENGRWLLPYDMLERPTTKTPLYNWIGAPVLAVFGPSEWALKFPAILSAVACVGLTVLMGWWLLRSEDHRALSIGLAAGAAWIGSTFGMKLAYLARPDGVLAAALIAAWICATVALQRGGTWPALGFWLCIAAAGLAKGPAMLIGLLYAVLAAKLVAGRWSTIHRLGWWWGLPLAVALVGGWAWAAYQTDPEGFRTGLVTDVASHESLSGGVGRMLLTVIGSAWELPAQFMARFAPWSIFLVLTLIHVPPRKWFRHPLGPAVLWLLLVMVVFTLSPRHRPDYLAPGLGAAAILAAYWLVVVADKYRIRPQHVMAVAAAVVVGLAVYYWYFSAPARTRYGEYARAFVQQVGRIVGDDPVIFRNTGYNELLPLLGRNPRMTPDHAQWIVQPVADDADAAPMLISGELAGMPHGESGRLGLYRTSTNPDAAQSP